MVRSLGPRATHVYEEIRARVLDGRYAPDTKLPPHDDLSREFGVALLTVRQAIARLQEEGLVTSLQGRGTFVGQHADDFEMTERSLRALVQSSPLPVYSLDAAGNVRSWNRACEELLGWTECEIVGRRPPHWPGGETPRLESAMRRTLGGETLSGEGVIQTSTGEILAVSGAVSPLHDADGYVVGSIWAFRDITDRKHAEDQLRLLTGQVVAEAARAHEVAVRVSRLQSVTAALSRALRTEDVVRVVLEQGIAAVRADAGSIALLADDGETLTVAHHTGYPAELVAPLRSFSINGDLPLAVAVRSRAPVWIPSWDVYRDHPQIGPIMARTGRSSAAALPLVVEGRPLGAIGLSFKESRHFQEEEREFVEALVAQCAQALDRAQVYEAARALSLARDAILAASPVPIVALDAAGRVTLWSPAAERLTGYSADEVLGRRPVDVSPEVRDRFEQYLSSITAGQRFSGVAGRRAYKDGKRLDLEVSAEPLYGPDGAVEGSIVALLDVTERERVLAQLRASEDRFRGVFRHSALPIAIVDDETRFLDVNASYERLLGYSRDELLGMTFVECTHPDDVDADVSMQRELLAGKREAYQLEKRYIRKDGETIWTSLSVSPLIEADGKRIGNVALVEDITERKRAEEERARLAAIVECSEDAIIGLTPEKIITSWNRGAEKLYGYGAQEVIGRSVEILVPPERLAELRTMQERVNAGESILNHQTIRRHRNGERLHIALTLSPIRDDAGTLVGVASIARDISTITLAEAAIRDSEERFRAVFEGASIGINVADFEGRFVDANPAFCAMLGYSHDEIVGKSVSDITHPDDVGVDLDLLRRLAVGERSHYELEKRYVRKDGQTRWVRLRVNPLRREDGTIRLNFGMVEDITERRATEVALQASEERYRSLVEMSPDAIILADLSGMVVMANHQADRLFGSDMPGKLLGRHVLEFVQPEQHEVAGERLREYLSGTAEGPGSEYSLLRFDGTSFPAEVVASTILDDAGTPIGLTVVARDISERKRAQQLVEEDARRLAATVEMQRIIGQDGRELFCAIQVVMERLCELTGADGSGVARLEDGGLVYVVTAGAITRNLHIGREGSLAGHAIRARKPLYAPETLDDPRVDQEAARRIGLRSLIVAPLEHDGEVIGALTLSALRPNAFCEQDLHTVALMTGQIAAAISRARAFDLLRSQLEFTETITESMAEGLMTVDAGARITFVNHAAQTLLGWDAEELVGRPVCEALGLRDGMVGERSLLDVLSSLEGTTFEDVAFARKDGSTIPVSGTASPLRGGDARGTVIVFRDIAEQHEFEARIRHQLVHDALTGLPNRTLLHDRLAEALDGTAVGEATVALLALDLNAFKDVNNSLGDEMGDLLLRQVGARLKQTVAEVHFLARLGDDEFAILAKGADQIVAFDLADRIHADLAAPFYVADRAMYVPARIGIALAPDHADDPALLMRRADVALHLAKSSGRSTALYSPERDATSSHRLELALDLREAIDRKEIVLFYQPKLDVATGELVGVEALARWFHPQRGFVPPDEFVGVAEQTDLIHPLTYLVLEMAAEQSRRWHDMGINISIAVNLSARNLTDPRLVETISTLIDRWGLQPGWLGVEITETAVMADSAHARLILALLQWQGISISVDDFGVGHSSLSYLKRLPVDEIKVDRSFVTGLARDEDDVFIVRSVIGLGHHLGLRVAAEGAESQEDLDILRELGCDVVQGYFFSKPLPAAELEQWLQLRRNVA